MLIPKEIKKIADQFKKHHFEVYLVGGCVRDLLLKTKPHDWDLTTNLRPEKIQKLFAGHSFLENDFGTVTVLTQSRDESLKAVEITPYRTEGEYRDQRHPESVNFVDNLEEDLSRRDFTINAMALDLGQRSPKVIDLFQGKIDLEKRIIRAVGNPRQRFAEDALRLMRAVRLATVLDFQIGSIRGNGTGFPEKDDVFNARDLRASLVQVVQDRIHLYSIQCDIKTNICTKALPF